MFNEEDPDLSSTNELKQKNGQLEKKRFLEPFLASNQGFNDCFGCSQTNENGLHLRIWVSEEGCYTRCVIPGHFSGFKGVIHGGIIATLLDEVAAWTIMTQFFQMGLTLEVRVKYLKPVPTDTEIVVKGAITKRDGKKVKVHSAIYSLEGNILSECESKWLLPNNATLAKVIGVEETVVERIMKETIDPIQQYMTENTQVKQINPD
ncbi:MAG: PaaI family thioesterase [Candidatus Hodarchaeales archaeon]|jgi:uncharacterized protein (TIGR00369 family)